MKQIRKNKKASAGENEHFGFSVLLFSLQLQSKHNGVFRCAQLIRPRPHRRTQILALRNKQMKARTDLTRPFWQHSHRRVRGKRKSVFARLGLQHSPLEFLNVHKNTFNASELNALINSGTEFVSPTCPDPTYLFAGKFFNTIISGSPCEESRTLLYILLI